MSGDAVADGLLVASRMLWYAGLVGVIGASAFRLSVSWAANGATAELGREAATTGLAAAAALLSGLLARLYAQTYAAFGVEERVTAALLLEVAVDLPPWSTGWMFQFAAAGISLPALIVARAGRRQGWAVAYVAAIALAASAPLTGHAVAQAEWYVLPVVLQASHVLGAGLWIGGLFVLLVVGVARAGRLRPQVLAALVNAFSPLALCGAGLVALTGAITAFLYLGAVADLWQTPYGRTLLMKIAMFGGVAGVGFVNWQRVRPRLTHAGGGEVLRRTAAVELLLAAIVLALTALLAGLAQPRGNP
jgi:putative copper export protein